MDTLIKAKSEGRAIDRVHDFESRTETYTTCADYGELMPNIERYALGVLGTIRRNDEQRAVMFPGNGWSALLEHVDEGGGLHVYRFSWLGWEGMGGAMLLQMNEVLTAVEKAFVATDPLTSVQSRRENVHQTVSVI